MGTTDRRNRLDAEVFSYHATKEGKVFVYYYGRHVITLKGARTERLLEQLEGANEKETQLALAKATGNFKRGNERRR